MIRLHRTANSFSQFMALERSDVDKLNASEQLAYLDLAAAAVADVLNDDPELLEQIRRNIDVPLDDADDFASALLEFSPADIDNLFDGAGDLHEIIDHYNELFGDEQVNNQFLSAVANAIKRILRTSSRSRPHI